MSLGRSPLRNQLSVYILTFFAGIHFSLSLHETKPEAFSDVGVKNELIKKPAAKRLWLGFYVLSYSGWIIETKAGKEWPCNRHPMPKALKQSRRMSSVSELQVDKWREENPQLQSQLSLT